MANFAKGCQNLSTFTSPPKFKLAFLIMATPINHAHLLHDQSSGRSSTRETLPHRISSISAFPAWCRGPSPILPRVCGCLVRRILVEGSRFMGGVELKEIHLVSAGLHAPPGGKSSMGTSFGWTDAPVLTSQPKSHDLNLAIVYSLPIPSAVFTPLCTTSVEVEHSSSFGSSKVLAHARTGRSDLVGSTILWPHTPRASVGLSYEPRISRLNWTRGTTGGSSLA